MQAGCNSSPASAALRAAFAGGVRVAPGDGGHKFVIACLCAIVECGISRHDLSFATSLIDELNRHEAGITDAPDALAQLRASFLSDPKGGVARSLYSNLTEHFVQAVRETLQQLDGREMSGGGFEPTPTCVGGY